MKYSLKIKREIVLTKLHGEVGITVVIFGAMMAVKLVSGVVLTRLLSPEAYGAVSLLMTVLFTLEMLSDLGFYILIVRAGDNINQKFINTVWTVKFFRQLINATILLTGAPAIAQILNATSYINEIRVGSIYFLFSAFESLGFLLAIRDQNSRTISFCELIAQIVSTVVSITLTYLLQNYWGMIIGMMANKAVMMALSYIAVPYHRNPKICFDRASAKDIINVSKVTIPSSLLTLAITQMDKLYIARLMPISVLGLYGIGQNIASMGEGLTSKLGTSILTPRFSQTNRSEDSNKLQEYYRKTIQPTRLMLAVPITIGAFATPIIATLYDYRYQSADIVVVAMTVRLFLTNYSTWATQLLLVCGHDRVQTIPPAMRALTLFIGCYFASKYSGFEGLLFAIAFEPITSIAYVKYLQCKHNLYSRNEEARVLLESAFLLIVSVILSKSLTFVVGSITGKTI